MNEHARIGSPVEIEEAGTRLRELVAAALRGETVVLSEAGALQVRLVPMRANTIEDVISAERAMTPQEIKERGAKRRAGLGMYEHFVTGPIPNVRDLKPTDEELLERERQKFGDLR